MNYITENKAITEHFNSYEFQCSCCGKIRIEEQFVKRLEKLFCLLERVDISVLLVNSGYRCDKFSKTLSGAFIGDMHNLGAAADIHAINTKGEYIDSYTLCEAAQLVGFGGIAVITDKDIHVDDRQRTEFRYANKQWYGNELTGENYMTFIGKSVHTGVLNKKINQKYVELMIDDHKYTGLLEEQ